MYQTDETQPSPKPESFHSNGTATTVPKRMATTALLVTLAAAIISMAD